MSELRGFKCDWCAAERATVEVPSGWLTRYRAGVFTDRDSEHFCSLDCASKFDQRQRERMVERRRERTGAF